MLSKCSNPLCTAPFRYLRNGRLFHLEIPVPPANPGPARRLERFWLCAQCCSTLTVVLEGSTAKVQPRFLELVSGERVEQSEEEQPFLA